MLSVFFVDAVAWQSYDGDLRTALAQIQAGGVGTGWAVGCVRDNGHKTKLNKATATE